MEVSSLASFGRAGAGIGGGGALVACKVLGERERKSFRLAALSESFLRSLEPPKSFPIKRPLLEDRSSMADVGDSWSMVWLEESGRFVVDPVRRRQRKQQRH
jgi:hypothetical protein